MRDARKTNDPLLMVYTLRSLACALSLDVSRCQVNGRIALSTKTLEPEPGDMLRDPAKVMELADETAAKYHARMEEERIAREEAAKDIVMGLGDLDSSGSSDLESVTRHMQHHTHQHG